MTTRNFDALFNPRRMVLVGASARPGSVGAVVTANLLRAGFDGPIDLVNPHAAEIDGHPCVARIADLAGTPDLAVVAIPAEAAPGVISELGAKGCRAAVVISAGFEGPGRPAELTAALLAAARPHLLRIVGPNCLGVLSPARKVNASFARAMPPAGAIALVAQSGAVAAAAMDWAVAAGLGFTHVVTVGDCADVDVADVLDHLAGDFATHGILLYLEGVADGRKFMSAARQAARAKPVAVIKAGRSAAGAKAALSHTGALAGVAPVYDAVFRRAGLLAADDLESFLQAAASFSAGLRGAGDRLAILTNGGGAGVLATDALYALGERLAVLSPTTLAGLSAVAPAAWSHGNPVDILGDAAPALYGAAAEILLAAPEVDALLTLNCPTAVADSAEAASALIGAAAGRGAKPVLGAWLGGPGMDEARRRFGAARLPSFETPEAGARAFAQLARLRRNRERLVHVPAAQPTRSDAATARSLVRGALAAGRTLLTDPEARQLLSAYGVPTVESAVAATPETAQAIAPRFTGPLVLKVLSPDITHKSDVGGVRLGVAPADAGAVALDLLAAVTRARPYARLDGVVIEPLVRRPAAEEVLAGIVRDPTFGPLVMVGQGGVAVEVAADRALGLPPLNDDLTRDMIGQTRLARRLAGYRGRPPADLAALSKVLMALGQMACDLPEIAELDINPLLCDADGVIALDARVALAPVSAATPRPAIAPYPADLTREISLHGQTIRLRAIRPDDALRLNEMIELSSPEDVRLRFRGAMRHLTGDLVERLTQIDYDRHLALVAEAADGAILGVGRLVRDPGGESAEFALMVRSDRQRQGLGHVLLQALIDAAAAQGLREVWGDVAEDNRRMCGLAHALGFKAAPGGELGRTRVARRLNRDLAARCEAKVHDRGPRA